MAARINKSILKNEISKAQSESLRKQAAVIANDLLIEKKKQYIEKIQNHPISEELSNGPSAENISRTLDGEGNLFSFIGFNDSDKPVEDLIDVIQKNTSIKEKDAKNGIFRFEVYSPSMDELKNTTRMPFEVGNSWLSGLEKGISGFSYYFYGLIFPSSRSGKAIQSKNRVRRANYKPTKYFSSLYKNFIESFN